MKLIKWLVIVFDSFLIFRNLILSIGFVVGGIYLIYNSQTEYFEKSYQKSMTLAFGIIILIIGVLFNLAIYYNPKKNKR
ncbi:hypothetical protein [Patiriisocius hiemis]|uniref:Uncharacterized protein n=1 Tax=Patiriisocius hiemis TaxID=3075604 RepID=A0ABU2Y9C7_9FLAO|nr:hypothetical protein [Constantimarinum sp. W242]MDT0554415.1 hypothetical protein [Constantimarinum sp. W242]